MQDEEYVNDKTVSAVMFSNYYQSTAQFYSLWLLFDTSDEHYNACKKFISVFEKSHFFFQTPCYSQFWTVACVFFCKC